MFHCAADGALHIYSVQQSDAGEYYCTAENRAGRHQRRSTLTITGMSTFHFRIVKCNQQITGRLGVFFFFFWVIVVHAVLCLKPNTLQVIGMSRQHLFCLL